MTAGYAAGLGSIPDDPGLQQRLAAFKQAHPSVVIRAPELQRYRWRAIIPASTVPGDPREMIVTAETLGEFLRKLDGLFARPD